MQPGLTNAGATGADVRTRRLSPFRAAKSRLPPAFGPLFDHPRWSLLAVALVLCLGLWTYVTVKTSMRELRTDALTALINTQIGAVEIWIDDKASDARRWASDPRVRSLVLSLVRRAQAPGADARALCAAPERRALLALLESFVNEERGIGINVINRAGQVIASRSEENCGLFVSETMRERLRGVFAGATRFFAPISESERLAQAPTATARDPLAWIEAPVAGEDGSVTAALGLGTYAKDRFDAIFRLSRLGESGEAYAVDSKGRLLSESRFADQTRRAGPSDRSGGEAAFGAPLLDPGAVRPESALVSGKSDATRLTELVDAAVRASESTAAGRRQGIILDPYRNYLGASVIGAWAWLPKYDFGIAVELGQDEAFAPLGRISTVFAIVLGALGTVAAVLLATVFSMMRLQKEVASARRVGSYVLLKKLGEGGMSTVYLARHALLKRPTAVKLIKLHRATDELLARFEREVNIASRLTHPNTIEIFDFGRAPDGTPYYAMEYVEGINFADLVERFGAQAPARVAYLLRQVCGSLKEAHGLGLVHRDIKPHNLMLCRLGGELDMVKVLDFGLVKDTTERDARALTKSMRILGTPLYMSPERIRDASAADARDDIYAVGAVGYLLLTGRPLFESDSDLDIATQVLNHPPQRPSALALQPIPEQLDRAIYRCLAKARADRPQTIDELIHVFDACMGPRPLREAAAQEWWAKHAAEVLRDDPPLSHTPVANVAEADLGN